MATSIVQGPLVDNIPVVFVSSGCMWGSGVLIHQSLGIILTCSHVVNGAKEGIGTYIYTLVIWYIILISHI